MVEHAAQGVAGVVALHRQLHRLADGDAEAAGAVRVLGEDGAAGLGAVAWAGDALGAEGLHVGASIGLMPSKLTRTMKTTISRSKKVPASASDEPHWPAPVSVVMRLTPSILL
jgi:hypothetical protein